MYPSNRSIWTYHCQGEETIWSAEINSAFQENRNRVLSELYDDHKITWVKSKQMSRDMENGNGMMWIWKMSIDRDLNFEFLYQCGIEKYINNKKCFTSYPRHINSKPTPESLHAWHGRHLN